MEPCPPATIRTDRIVAVLFDLDGVVTDTAGLHAEAWTQLFDDFLATRSDQPGEDHRPFTHDDYLRHVDGKARLDGVEAFLDSRGITLPRGVPSDPEDASTVHGLGARKNRFFRERLDERGPQVFDSTVRLVHRLQDAGVATAVFSASRNCRAVLEAAGLGALFPVRVDGLDAAELALPGKPDPAMLLEAARRVDVEPALAVVVEDALAGVEAGRRGGFGMVIGVDRAGQRGALAEHGADVVVDDLADVRLVPGPTRRLSEVPDAISGWEQIRTVLRGRRRVAVFLDFDGTLSPIVDDPAAARLVDGAAAAIHRLAARCPVAVVSGRDLRDVQARVGIADVWYAGSHGFELAGPNGEHHEHEPAHDALPALDEAEQALRDRLGDVPGAIVERKRFSVAAHYRNVAADLASRVVDAAEEVSGAHPELRTAGGRRVVEVRPDLDWDKGRALDFLRDTLDVGRGALSIFVGDDLTDEDALAVVRDEGLGVVVRSTEHGDRATAAQFAVDGPEQLCDLLDRIAEVLEEAP